jgi:hypothetical protein
VTGREKSRLNHGPEYPNDPEKGDTMSIEQVIDIFGLPFDMATTAEELSINEFSDWDSVISDEDLSEWNNSAAGIDY